MTPHEADTSITQWLDAHPACLPPVFGLHGIKQEFAHMSSQHDRKDSVVDGAGVPASCAGAGAGAVGDGMIPPFANHEQGFQEHNMHVGGSTAHVQAAPHSAISRSGDAQPPHTGGHQLPAADGSTQDGSRRHNVNGAGPIVRGESPSLEHSFANVFDHANATACSSSEIGHFVDMLNLPSQPSGGTTSPLFPTLQAPGADGGAGDGAGVSTAIGTFGCGGGAPDLADFSGYEGLEGDVAAWAASAGIMDDEHVPMPPQGSDGDGEPETQPDTETELPERTQSAPEPPYAAAAAAAAAAGAAPVSASAAASAAPSAAKAGAKAAGATEEPLVTAHSGPLTIPPQPGSKTCKGLGGASSKLHTVQVGKVFHQAFKTHIANFIEARLAAVKPEPGAGGGPPGTTPATVNSPWGNKVPSAGTFLQLACDSMMEFMKAQPANVHKVHAAFKRFLFERPRIVTNKSERAGIRVTWNLLSELIAGLYPDNGGPEHSMWGRRRESVEFLLMSSMKPMVDGRPPWLESPAVAARFGATPNTVTPIKPAAAALGAAGAAAPVAAASAAAPAAAASAADAVNKPVPYHPGPAMSGEATSAPCRLLQAPLTGAQQQKQQSHAHAQQQQLAQQTPLIQQRQRHPLPQQQQQQQQVPVQHMRFHQPPLQSQSQQQQQQQAAQPLREHCTAGSIATSEAFTATATTFHTAASTQQQGVGAGMHVVSPKPPVGGPVPAPGPAGQYLVNTPVAAAALAAAHAKRASSSVPGALPGASPGVQAPIGGPAGSSSLHEGTATRASSTAASLGDIDDRAGDTDKDSSAQKRVAARQALALSGRQAAAQQPAHAAPATCVAPQGDAPEHRSEAPAGPTESQTRSASPPDAAATAATEGAPQREASPSSACTRHGSVAMQHQHVHPAAQVDRAHEGALHMANDDDRAQAQQDGFGHVHQQDPGMTAAPETAWHGCPGQDAGLGTPAMADTAAGGPQQHQQQHSHAYAGTVPSGQVPPYACVAPHLTPAQTNAGDNALRHSAASMGYRDAGMSIKVGHAAHESLNAAQEGDQAGGAAAAAAAAAVDDGHVGGQSGGSARTTPPDSQTPGHVHDAGASPSPHGWQHNDATMAYQGVSMEGPAESLNGSREAVPCEGVTSSNPECGPGHHAHSERSAELQQQQSALAGQFDDAITAEAHVGAASPGARSAFGGHEDAVAWPQATQEGNSAPMQHGAATGTADVHGEAELAPMHSTVSERSVGSGPANQGRLRGPDEGNVARPRSARKRVPSSQAPPPAAAAAVSAMPNVSDGPAGSAKRHCAQRIAARAPAGGRGHGRGSGTSGAIASSSLTASGAPPRRGRGGISMKGAAEMLMALGGHPVPANNGRGAGAAAPRPPGPRRQARITADEAQPLADSHAASASRANIVLERDTLYTALRKGVRKVQGEEAAGNSRTSEHETPTLTSHVLRIVCVTNATEACLCITPDTVISHLKFAMTKGGPVITLPTFGLVGNANRREGITLSTLVACYVPAGNIKKLPSDPPPDVRQRVRKDLHLVIALCHRMRPFLNTRQPFPPFTADELAALQTLHYPAELRNFVTAACLLFAWQQDPEIRPQVDLLTGSPRAPRSALTPRTTADSAETAPALQQQHAQQSPLHQQLQQQQQPPPQVASLPSSPLASLAPPTALAPPEGRAAPSCTPENSAGAAAPEAGRGATPPAAAAAAAVAGASRAVAAPAAPVAHDPRKKMLAELIYDQVKEKKEAESSVRHIANGVEELMSTEEHQRQGEAAPTIADRVAEASRKLEELQREHERLSNMQDVIRRELGEGADRIPLEAVLSRLAAAAESMNDDVAYLLIGARTMLSEGLVKEVFGDLA